MRVTQKLALWCGAASVLLSSILALQVISAAASDRGGILVLLLVLYVAPTTLITSGHYLSLSDKQPLSRVLLTIGVVLYLLSILSFIGGTGYFLGWLGLAPLIAATLTLCLICAKDLKEAFWIGPPEE